MALLLFLRELESQLARVRGTDKAHKIALRETRTFLDLEAVAILVLRPARGREAVRFNTPRQASWPAELLDGLRRGVHDLPRDLAVVPLRRRGRRWAWLLARSRGAFTRAARRELVRIAGSVSASVQRLDRVRLLEVRQRIDRKLLEPLRHKDLFYHVLHALRSLTRYDHAAAILIEEDGRLELVAEKIAWCKAKSRRIGARCQLTDEARALLALGEPLGFDRGPGGWRFWESNVSGHGDQRAVAMDLVEQLADGPGDPRARALAADETDAELAPGSVLLAPLVGPDGLLGVLRMSGCQPGALSPWECGVVSDFLPPAAVALRRMQRTVTLEQGLLEAEKKHAMANLARGVSHDVNNALGSTLPLVQQLLAEVEGEQQVPVDVLRDDLARIEASLQVCRRIFNGMLQFARAGGRTLGEGDLAGAVRNTLALLDESLRRQAVAVTVDLTDGLPAVCGGQGDLEQLVLNLASNARDAMPRGGELTLRARRADDVVLLEVRDTGCGIPAEVLDRVQEPFFTTRDDGSGLGLSICRSIVWALGGRLEIDSAPGRGTTVSVRLPTS